MSKAARTTTSKRETSAYETPTDEKRAFGARMREAREIAGMTITEAAESMGYSQPVQLSLMETGIRMPTLRVIVACATLYGTTMDFLAGFVPDSDRDPAAALQRHVASRIAAEFQRLGRQMSVMSVDVVRELMPNAADGQRLACLVLEVSSSLATYRARNPGFDDTRASSTLASKIELASMVATQYAAQVARSKRLMQASGTRAAAEGADGKDGQISLLPVLDLVG